MALANPSDSASLHARVQRGGGVGGRCRPCARAAAAVASALLLLTAAAAAPGQAAGAAATDDEAAVLAQGTSEAPEPEDTQALLQIHAPAPKSPRQEVEDVMASLRTDPVLRKGLVGDSDSAKAFSLESFVNGKLQTMSSAAIVEMKVMANELLAPWKPAKCAPHRGVWKAFDGWSQCNSTTTFYCPRTQSEVQEIVTKSKQVRSTGNHHSWTPFTCTSGAQPFESATIDMRGMDTIYGIDTERNVVRLQGGVVLRDLLEYLGQHRYKLLSWSFFVDQTVAGAVATATHGSDMEPGRQTLSSQIRTMTLVMADGSIMKVDRNKDPELMKVTAVGIGKMGVITELEMDVEPDFCVVAGVQEWVEDSFLETLKSLKRGGKKLLGDYKRGLRSVDAFWLPFRRKVVGAMNKKNPPGCIPKTRVDQDVDYVAFLALMRQDKITGYQYDQWRQQNPELSEELVYNDATTKYFCTEGCWASSGRLINSLYYSKVVLPQYKYSQFEWAIPLNKAYGCFSKLLNEIASTKATRYLWSGEAMLLRFVGQSDEWMGATTDGPRMFANMDIDVAFRPHSAEECTKWEEIFQHFNSDTCSGRLHVGKAGWELMDAAQADAMYPMLPKFRSKIKEFDPSGKFRGATPVFSGTSGAPSKGTCVGTSPWNMATCGSAERQASECMCTAGQWGTCTWQLMPETTGGWWFR